MTGAGGELLEVFSDKVEITSKGFLGFLAKGLKGTKTIPFHSVTGIQFKKADFFTSGYLQFTIPGGRESHGGLFTAAADENTFMFRAEAGNNDRALEIKHYVERKVQEMRAPRPSAFSLSDELQKLATLKSQGMLSDSELEEAKKRLLG
jgi:hypothetical protein